ncbi:MAG: type II/IV secretion system protein [Firmicutes bacterium]|nr:type II/IV secretion system protein [Bacillota bacterium]
MFRSLEELLLETGMATQEQINEARKSGKGSNIAEALTEIGVLTQQQYIEIMEFHLGVPHVTLDNYQLKPEVLKILDPELVKRYKAVPLDKSGDRLTVAMADPKNVVAIDDIAMATGCQVIPVIAAKSDLDRVIRQHYTLKESVERVVQETEPEEDIDPEELALMVDDAPIVRLVDNMIEQAVNEGASDIHIEPRESELVVRFRIDGILHERMSPPKSTHPLVVSRLKIMANLDIAERRIPQDGRIKFRLNDNATVDLRMNTLPTIYGEKVVLRILNPESIMLKLSDLGFSSHNYEKFKDIITRSYGIVLVTGPTGSGKTTTLYSALNYINSPHYNISTVEDPVEYRLEGINQVNVHSKIGMTFNVGLRALLRQDPDVIMIGEIRDTETLETAVRAALTGHLVLSTIHTNDAPSTLTRMIEMGLPPFLVVAATNGIVAQRLVRRLCRNCQGEGCSTCNRTGFKGRLAVHEVLTFTDTLRQAVLEGMSASRLRKLAREEGMVTMYEDGMEKVKMGLTTREEVVRVVGLDYV